MQLFDNNSNSYINTNIEKSISEWIFIILINKDYNDYFEYLANSVNFIQDAFLIALFCCCKKLLPSEAFNIEYAYKSVWRWVHINTSKHTVPSEYTIPKGYYLPKEGETVKFYKIDITLENLFKILMKDKSIPILALTLKDITILSEYNISNQLDYTTVILSDKKEYLKELITFDYSILYNFKKSTFWRIYDNKLENIPNNIIAKLFRDTLPFFLNISKENITENTFAVFESLVNCGIINCICPANTSISSIILIIEVLNIDFNEIYVSNKQLYSNLLLTLNKYKIEKSIKCKAFQIEYPSILDTNTYIEYCMASHLFKLPLKEFTVNISELSIINLYSRIDAMHFIQFFVQLYCSKINKLLIEKDLDANIQSEYHNIKSILTSYFTQCHQHAFQYSDITVDGLDAYTLIYYSNKKYYPGRILTNFEIIDDQSFLFYLNIVTEYLRVIPDQVSSYQMLNLKVFNSWGANKSELSKYLLDYYTKNKSLLDQYSKDSYFYYMGLHSNNFYSYIQTIKKYYKDINTKSIEIFLSQSDQLHSERYGCHSTYTQYRNNYKSKDLMRVWGYLDKMYACKTCITESACNPTVLDYSIVSKDGYVDVISTIPTISTNLKIESYYNILFYLNSDNSLKSVTTLNHTFNSLNHSFNSLNLINLNSEYITSEYLIKLDYDHILPSLQDIELF